MKNNLIEWNGIEILVDELIEGQKKVLLTLGRRIVPTLTTEDMLQPNDYPTLEYHPEFRYEEGILAGLQAMQMALRAQFKKDISG